ncbi:MAG: hypothetical protein NTX22_17380 [Ignavibacteriales bacterium]|nr:hypothetical protein [Ignavibacteriales bacterium]
MKAKFLFVIIIITFLSLITGCYTILVHPSIENTDENGYTYENNVTFYDDCSSCHKDIAPRNIVTPEILKTHPSYSNFSYYDLNEDYYSDSYFGNYGYYYNYPWWLEVAPPAKYKKTEQYTGKSRDNSSERGAARDRSPQINLPSPTTSGNSGSSSSTNQSKETTKSSDSSDRNSSSTPSSRDNDGNRSTDSGRRR